MLLVLFVWVQARTSSPMVALSLFRSPAFLGANVFTLFLYAALSTFFFLFPVTLMQVYRYSATAAGAATLPMILLMFFLSRWSGGLVNRYGGKVPLIVGPVLVAVGFILCAELSARGDYWKSFFVPLLVLGSGMAVTVAPLTTVVMNSIDRAHSGVASGINNAVSRLAGVLAIAVLGIVLVKNFATQLDRRLSNLSLPSEAVQEMRSKDIELAGMRLPKNLDPDMAMKVQQAISQAFLVGFRLILFGCAVLSVGSGLVAWWHIPSEKQQNSEAK